MTKQRLSLATALLLTTISLPFLGGCASGAHQGSPAPSPPALSRGFLITPHFLPG